MKKGFLLICMALTGLALTSCLTTPDKEAPTTPTLFMVSPGNSELTATWAANPAPDLKNYNLYWGTAANNLSNTILIDKNINSKTITGLTNGTPYFFALDAVDNSGNASAKTVAVQATPVAPNPADTTRPTLVSSTPSDLSSDVVLNSKLVLTFSEPMQASSLTVVYQEGGIMRKQSNNARPLAVPTPLNNPVISNDNKTFSYEGLSWKASSDYTVQVSGKDLAGNALVLVFIDFRTVGTTDTTPPRIVQTTPDNNAVGIAAATKLSITFDDDMKAAETIAAISSSVALGCTWQAETTRIFSCTATLATDTAFIITIGTGAQDDAGNALAAPYSFSFTTIATVGKLRISIVGVPTGKTATVKITGPDAYSSSTTKNATFSNLKPGDYKITANTIVVKTTATSSIRIAIPVNPPITCSYTPTIVSSPATVTAGSTTQVSVDYVEDCI